MRYKLISVIFLIAFFARCKQQSFSGSNTKPALVISPTPAITSSPAPTIAPSPVPVGSPTPVPTCMENLTYKPEEILCHLPVGSDTVWANTDGWKTLSNNFRDRQAEWLSPLAAKSCDGHACCPFVPNSNKLFFVSNFTIEVEDYYLYESITDDIGVVKFWKNMDPNQVTLKTPSSTGSSGSVLLQKGQYAVVIEATDTNSTATGAIFALRNNQGNVIKHTGQNDNWCIFQVTSDVVAETFVPTAASCKKCFGKP